MTRRDWRSPDAYSDLEDAPLREIAWEYLQRNSNYIEDYERMTSDAAAEQTARRWGLRFPHRPAQKRRRGQAPLEPRNRSRRGRLILIAIAVSLAIAGTALGYCVTADIR